MVIYTLIVSIIILTVIYIVIFANNLRNAKPLKLSAVMKIKLIFSGIIAFIADVFGVGSFAVNIALAKILKTFRDDEMPAVCNGAQVLPGTIESLFFMQIINVDITTLLVLVAGTCIGGVCGSKVLTSMRVRAIRRVMVLCLSFAIIVLLCDQLQLFAFSGHHTALRGWPLFLGFVGMILCGAFAAVGIGLFALVQMVLFMLQVSPLVAFPIMTTAGAMQQPLTSIIYLKHNKIPLLKTLILSVSGCLGVLLILPIFTNISPVWLHRLLIIVLLYNVISIAKNLGYKH
jgi:uncharacterized membrane protein YfcA